MSWPAIGPNRRNAKLIPAPLASRIITPSLPVTRDASAERLTRGKERCPVEAGAFSVHASVVRLARLRCRSCGFEAVHGWQHSARTPFAQRRSRVPERSRRRSRTTIARPVDARVGPKVRCRCDRTLDVAKHRRGRRKVAGLLLGWRSFGARAPSLFDIPRDRWSARPAVLGLVGLPPVSVQVLRSRMARVRRRSALSLMKPAASFWS